VRKKFGKTREEAEEWLGELRDALRDVAAAALDIPVPAIEPEPAALPAPDDPWLAELREAVSGEVSFELGGIRLSTAEVRDAVAALKSAKGNRVLPAFKDTGHKLKDAGKTWYLEFAEEVMQAYPELRTPVRRHAEGHFGRVKQALIFGLERFLDAVPAVAPEAPAEPVLAAEPVDVPVSELPSEALWADLESVLARFPGFDDERKEAAMAAVRLLVPA
jgi:hypothetical protein